MYGELLSMTWDAMMDTDYLFKSNMGRHVVELPGIEVTKNDKDESIILIFYNVYTGVPMILLHRIDNDLSCDVEVVEGYVESVTKGVSKNGENYTEVLYTQAHFHDQED